MNFVEKNILKLKQEIPSNVTLIAVSKTHPIEIIQQAYDAGIRDFGENKVQELISKQPHLPQDIRWHLIGHLQSNKVKYIAQFVHLIHSVDSYKLLVEINKQAQKSTRIIDCLLQIYIAKEETKFGFSFEEAEQLLRSEELKTLQNIRITGLMGMATNTENTEQIANEFKQLKFFFNSFSQHETQNLKLETLSMGMSSDYHLAIQEGSNMIRVGSVIFGNRNYQK